MALKTSQRFLLCKKNFMALHGEGKTIEEIANIFDLSKWTIYKNLQTIADENNVSRDSLLKIVHKKYCKKLPSGFPPSIETINSKDLTEKIHEMKNKASYLIKNIEVLLNESEDNLCQD